MSFLSTNIIDGGVIIFVAISASFSLGRGFVREVITIAAWVGACLAPIYLLPQLRPWIALNIGDDILVQTASGPALFILAFIALRIVGSIIVGALRLKEASGHLDHFFGLTFGLVRAIFLICLAYILLSYAVPFSEQPKFITQSRSFAIIFPLSKFITSFVPERYDIPLGPTEEDRSAEKDHSKDAGGTHDIPPDNP